MIRYNSSSTSLFTSKKNFGVNPWRARVRIPHWWRHAALTTDQRKREKFIPGKLWSMTYFFASLSLKAVQICNERLSHLCVRFGSPRVKSDKFLDWIDVDELCASRKNRCRRLLVVKAYTHTPRGELIFKKLIQGKNLVVSQRWHWRRIFFFFLHSLTNLDLWNT